MPPSPHGDSALLVGSVSDWSDVEAIVRGLGYRPWLAGGSDDLTALTLRLGLCVVDLRHHGDALRTVRAVRARQPHAVLVGIADPQRPATTVEAVRAGVFEFDMHLWYGSAALKELGRIHESIQKKAITAK